MRIQSVKSNRQNMYLPRKFLPLVWRILQRPPFFARKNGRIGTASDSLQQWRGIMQCLRCFYFCQILGKMSQNLSSAAVL